MIAVTENQPATIYTRCQQSNCKRCSEAVEVEISSADSFCLTNQFLAHGGSLHIFINTMASTQRKTQPLLQNTSLFCCFFESPGLHIVGSGLSVARFSMNIKTAKTSFESSRGISTKFCTIENFLPYDI